MSAFGGILDIVQWVLSGGASSDQRIQEANIARNKRQAEQDRWLASQGTLADHRPPQNGIGFGEKQ